MACTTEEAILCVYRGDDKIITTTFKDELDNPIDITGYTVYFTVKEKEDETVDDSNALIQVDVTSHLDPVNGKTNINLTNIQTNIPVGKYVYDIQWKDTGGKIKTIVSDKFIVYKDTTKRTT